MANGILSHKGTIYNIEASSSPNSIEVFRSKTCKSTYLVHIGREYRMSLYLKVRVLGPLHVDVNKKKISQQELTFYS